ncbi:YtcA family lipoprotein [Stappia sp. ICDLI1TA098]|jgi:hypothetical protein
MTMFPILSLSMQAMAPSVPLFGSFFPSWLICLLIAVILTVATRVVFVITGVDDILRWRVPTYMSMTLALTFLMSLMFFGR